MNRETNLSTPTSQTFVVRLVGIQMHIHQDMAPTDTFWLFCHPIRASTSQDS